jgi:CubicO group peptidase (beta-lactamase class C family)
MLDLDPGTVYHYSNYCFLLAGAVVERVTKMPYFDYVKTTLLQPAGITEVEVFPTLASTEVRHDKVGKAAKWFRISSGNRRVYTTFAIEFEALRKGEVKLLQ